METSTILDELEILVADKLQAVSYKWLSREFMVSSNVAKRLLQEFVDTRKQNFQAVYTLSGWSKENPTNYQIKLIPDAKLEETKREYSGHCSVHVYSVQSCLPKDSASLRDDEFAQSEDLFKQPINIQNCLRDNRFGAIAAPFVKREIESGEPVSKAESSKSNIKLQQCTTSKPANHAEDAKPPLQVTGKVNSLTNMWGRASEKSKSIGQNSADAQIGEMEFMLDDLIDDEEEVTIKRKRRVVFDFSDDESEEFIGLLSPELKMTTEKPVSDEPSKLVSVTEEKTKRKVVKTRIDDRGREVTEVVFEGDDVAAKNDEKPRSDPVAKKSQAAGNKTQGKKGGNNDPKQGKILSFFKKA